MKKNRMIAMLAAALCAMAAVTAPMPVTFVANASDTQYTTVAYDWPYYATTDELLAKANCLFEGTVRSIHFENCQIGSQTMLCTFYEIEVQKRYCDTVSNVVMLRVEGGIQDVRAIDIDF